MQYDQKYFCSRALQLPGCTVRTSLCPIGVCVCVFVCVFSLLPPIPDIYNMLTRTPLSNIWYLLFVKVNPAPRTPLYNYPLLRISDCESEKKGGWSLISEPEETCYFAILAPGCDCDSHLNTSVSGAHSIRRMHSEHRVLRLTNRARAYNIRAMYL